MKLQVNVGLFIAFIVFSWGSWIDIMGVMSEIPLMIPHLPEGWSIAIYISAAVQIPFVSSIIILGIYTLCPQKMRENVAIYAILIMGILAMLFLALFWKTRTYIKGRGGYISITMLLLIAVLGVVDNSSSVVFFPYAKRFPLIYLRAMFVGEGLTGMIPAILKIIQGGAVPFCSNMSVVTAQHLIMYNTDNFMINRSINANESIQVTFSKEQLFTEPRFSVGVFFAILAVVLLASLVAFAIIEHKKSFVEISNTHCRHRLDILQPSFADSTKTRLLSGFNQNISGNMNCSTEISSIQWDLNKTLEDVNEVTARRTSRKALHGWKPLSQNVAHQGSPEPDRDSPRLSHRAYIYLLAQTWFSSLLLWGIIYSTYTYSLLPYGFNLTNTTLILMNVLRIGAYGLATLVPLKTLTRINIIYTFFITACVYLIVCAAFSPCPPLVQSKLGGILAAFCLVFADFSMNWIRTCVGDLMMLRMNRAPMLFGLYTNVGVSMGAILCLIIDVRFKLLKSRNICEQLDNECSGYRRLFLQN